MFECITDNTIAFICAVVSIGLGMIFNAIILKVKPMMQYNGMDWIDDIGYDKIWKKIVCGTITAFVGLIIIAGMSLIGLLFYWAFISIINIIDCIL